MRRRKFLATTTALLATGGLAGCTANGSDDDTTDDPETETPTQSASPPTETPATPTAGTTGTPEWVSESCDSAPTIDGVPSRPETLTEDSVVEYAREFERTYVVATNDEYREIESIDVTNVENDSDGYHVQLAVEGVAATSTDEENGTETPRPADATAHRATYRLFGPYLRREHRGHAGGQLISAECWTVDNE
jgi:hypothetical protein